MGRQRKKVRAEIATGIGRKIRDRTGKGNQMTALRFQTGGRGDIRHPQPPFRGCYHGTKFNDIKNKGINRIEEKNVRDKNADMNYSH